MKRFWSLYMLFFTIPFPIILYYSIHGDMNKEPSTNQLVALCLLGISVILWGTILYRYFQKWVRTPFRIQSAISQLLRNGTRREAKIMDVVQLKPASPDVETFEIQVEMENFNGTTISQRLQINDSRPEDKRYEVGKTIRLRIDETLESRPFIIPESIQLTIKHSKGDMLVWRSEEHN